ncbi:MAG: hypothetical protein COT36_01025, partial [Parcubacteria group bacterium CG08_land_8_20_14_0_20_38_56]
TLETLKETLSQQELQEGGSLEKFSVTGESVEVRESAEVGSPQQTLSQERGEEEPAEARPPQQAPQESVEEPAKVEPQQQDVEVKLPQQPEEPVEVKPAQQEVAWCEIGQQKPSQDKVIINEVAWMGTVNSSNDEWMELKNVSGQTVNLANWQLFDKQKQIKIIFENPASIPASGFYLLERTDDNSVPHIRADLIYTGSLGNTNEALYLFDSTCQLRDKVSADSDWPAGNNLATEKRTMERNSDLRGWHTYSGYQNNGIWGTPKAENSSKGSESSSATAGISGGGSSSAGGGGGSSGGSSEDYIPPEILITEVQIEGENINHDFIELYNPSTGSVNISGFQLKKKSSTGKEYSIRVFPENSIILAQGYFLWANSDYASSAPILADVASTQTLAKDNSIALFDKYDNVIDAVAWGAGLSNPFFEKSPFLQNPGKFQSIERKKDTAGKYIDNNDNLNDFEIKDCPSPQSKTNPGGIIIKCYSSSTTEDEGGEGDEGEDENNEQYVDIDAPIADAGPDQTVIINQPITFDGSSDNIGITLYQWDVDDSDGLNWTNPDLILTGKNPTFKNGYSAAGTYTVTLKVSDEAGNFATDTLSVSVILPPLISEVQISPINERFVELYNPNNEDINLTGWYIQRKTETGASWTSFITSTQFKGKIIQSHSHFLIARLNGNADIVLNLTLTPNNSLVLKNSSRRIIDMVGWGAAAQDFETEPAPNLGEYQSIGRKWMEETKTYQDTDNNYLDFEIQVPTPKAQNRKDTT